MSDPGLPTGATSADTPFDTHLRQHLVAWCDTFRIAGVSLLRIIDQITVSVDGHTWTLDLAGEQHPGTTTSRATRDHEIAEALEDPWHHLWVDAIEHTHPIESPLLHPETRWSFDPYALATYRCAFMLAARDRDNPELEPRFDADRDPMSNDIGVIAFPWRSQHVLAAAATMCDTASIGRIAAAAALCEAGLHETFEMYQHTLGEPVWDPHTANIEATARFRVANSYHTLELYL